MHQYQRLRQYFQKPRISRFDPLLKPRSAHVLIPTAETISTEIKHASLQQLATIALRLINIARAIYSWPREEQPIWRGRNIGPITPSERRAIRDLAGQGVPGWPVPDMGGPIALSWPNNTRVHLVGLFVLLNNLVVSPSEDYPAVFREWNAAYPQDDLDVQRTLEAWEPEDIYLEEELSTDTRIALIYYQVLQTLVRWTRQLYEWWHTAKKKDWEPLFISDAALWLAYIPSILHGDWTRADDYHFLIPGVVYDPHEGALVIGTDPEPDLSDLEPNPVGMEERFPELWQAGLDKVWREINSVVPWVPAQQTRGRGLVGSPSSYQQLRRHLQNPRIRRFDPLERGYLPPEIDEDVEVSDLPLYPITGVGTELEDVAFIREEWDELPAALKRVAGAVALDLAIPNLLEPFYSKEDRSAISLGATKACSGLAELAERFVDWILDNPEKASLPQAFAQQLGSAIGRCNESRPYRTWDLPSNRALNKSRGALSDLYLSYTQQSSAWLRSATLEAIQSLACVDLEAQGHWMRLRDTWRGETQTAALDYEGCLANSFRLWWEEVQRVLAFSLPQGRTPFG